MAGDWIPYDLSLPTKREVQLIAKATRLSRFEVMGRLMTFWGWASGETSDGELPGLGLSDLEKLVGFKKNFWNSIVKVGWILVKTDGLFLPNAEHWITKGAKARLQKNRRQSRWRDARVDAHVDAGCASKASTTEQNRTEEKRREKKRIDAGGGVLANGAEKSTAAAAEICRSNPYLGQILDPALTLHQLAQAHPELDLVATVRRCIAWLTPEQIAQQRRKGKGPAKALTSYFDIAAREKRLDQARANGSGAPLDPEAAAAAERRREEIIRRGLERDRRELDEEYRREREARRGP
jgi:hypothetical protein